MHLVQARILFFSEANFTHCKLGFCFLLIVGLNFPLNFTLLQAEAYFFSQIVHCFVIWIIIINILVFGKSMVC